MRGNFFGFGEDMIEEWRKSSKFVKKRKRMVDCMITVALTDWLSAEYLLNIFVENAGYWLVFVFMVVESSFLPFPSEVVVPPAAFLAVTKGEMHVATIVVVATAGALVGALINYGLSVWIGRPLVYAFAGSRVGHACLLDRAKVERAERYFDEHGAISTFIGRLIPAVRQLISIPAGLARMNLVTFSAFTALGAGVWNTALALLGAWLGHHISLDQLYGSVEKYNVYFTWGGFGLLALCLAYIVYNALKKKR